MKKIFKLFLCLLMLVSFTNVTRVFAEEEGEYLDVQDVVDNYMNTNFMRGLLIGFSRIGEAEVGPDVDLTGFEIQLDTTNKKINFVDGSETVISFDYTDEYISYKGTEPEEMDDVDIGKALAESYYTLGMYYAILDTAGYADKEATLDDEEYDYNEEFYNQYGIYEEDGKKEFTGEDYEGSVTYLKELRFSLSRTKIANLINTYGTARADYVKLFSGGVVKPELTVTKKNATIVVKWNDDFNANKYVVYRSDKKDGKYTKLATYERDEEDETIKHSYTDKKVEYGKKYYYKVKSIGDPIEGKANTDTSEVKGLKMVPAKVKNVKLGAVKTNSIKVSWDKENETGYVIERSTNNKTWKAVKTITKKDTLAYTDKGLTGNKRYYYRVRAYKSVGRKVHYGAYSDVVNVVTAPDKPKFTVSANTYDSLKLAITAVKGATKYEIYRAPKKDGTYTKIAETNTTAYTDTGLKFGKTYFYKVRGCNKYNKCGTLSSIVSTKVIIKTPKITLETGAKVPMTINVKGLVGVEGYVIERSTSKKGTYKAIKTLTSDVKSYEDLGAKKGKTYYYRVRSFVTINGEKKYSAYSDIKSLTNLYNAPATPKVKVAIDINEFRGVYKKGNAIIKIYPNESEVADFYYENGEDKDRFVIFFEDGKLIYDDEKQVEIKLLTNNGIQVSGLSSELDGQYTGVRDYNADEYYTDKQYPAEYLNTKYNGYFETDGGFMYVAQLSESTANIWLEEGEAVKELELEIGETHASTTDLWTNYILTIDGSTATLEITADGDQPTRAITFNRVKDVSKGKLIDFFIDRRK